jgi:hypothetical protein
MKWYWPKLTGLEESEQAARQGAGACFLIAVITAIMAGISAWFDKPVMGVDAWGFADALIFAAAGWRIWLLSRTSAVLALAIFIIETVYAVESSRDVPAAGAYVRAVLALVLIGSVRGTFAYHAFRKKESGVSLEATVGGNQ